MITDLTQLQIEAKTNANKHGWIIFWNREDMNPKQKGHLSVGEALNLISGECSGEATQAYRDLNKKAFGEEAADIAIRLLHLCGDVGIDLTAEINTKMSKNKERAFIHGHKVY